MALSSLPRFPPAWPSPGRPHRAWECSSGCSCHGPIKGDVWLSRGLNRSLPPAAELFSALSEAPVRAGTFVHLGGCTPPCYGPWPPLAGRPARVSSVFLRGGMVPWPGSRPSGVPPADPRLPAVSLENVLLDVKELGRGMDLIRRECSIHDNSVLRNFLGASEGRLEKLQKDARTAEVRGGAGRGGTKPSACLPAAGPTRQGRASCQGPSLLSLAGLGL